MTVGDRVSISASLLGGRTDKNDQITNWICNSYRDLANSIPFETLEDTEDMITVQGAAGFPPVGDTYDYPSGARAIKAITLGIPAGNPTGWIPIYKRNTAIIDRYSTAAPGVPAIWAPFGTQFILRPVPNNSYPIRIRFWIRVNIPPDSDIAGQNAVEIDLPDDWFEILDYATQMRGYMDLQEFDKAGAIRQLLYGNPKHPDKPGLIKQRLTRIQAEAENANYGLRPRMVRYTNVR